MGETKGPKIGRKGVLVALGIICIGLAACLGVAVAEYSTMINAKSSTISSLNNQISQLNSTITNLQNQVAYENSTIGSLTSQVTNLQEQLNLTVGVVNYTVIGTLSYANLSAIYPGIVVESISPSFYPNLVGSFIFLTFNGELSPTFPSGFAAGNVVEINGTISFDEQSQNYFLNWLNGVLTTKQLYGINKQLDLQLMLQKTNYSLGEPINLTLTLTNISNQTATVLLSAYNNFDFQVYNGTNNVLYQWSNRWLGVAIPQVIWAETLNSGESLSQSFVWNQTCHNTGLSEGIPVSPGTYYIVGQIGSVLSGKNSTIETMPMQIFIT